MHCFAEKVVRVMSVPFRLMLLSTFASILFWVPDVNAAPPSGRRQVTSMEVSFERAKTGYLKLLKQDPEVTDLAAWERTAGKLLKFAGDFPASPDTPEAFWLLGQVYEQTYAKRSFRTGLSQSVYFYERLAKEFQGNKLVPDALLHLGDLRRGELKDEAAARSAYYEILDVYPKSDATATAKLRLGIAEEPKKVAVEQPVAQASAQPSPSPLPSPTPEPEAKGGIFGGLFSSEPKVGADGKQIVSEPSSLKRPVIVIDPGHGGEELGAVGVDGVLEKDVVLHVAMYLDELLRERLRAKTVLTRTTDVTLPLAERTKIANANAADLFISVHANASEFKTVHGIETYYLDNTNDKSSLKLAERENASPEKASSDLGFIMSDFIQSAKLDESISLAHYLQDSLVGTLSRYFQGVKDLGVKKAPFYVLVGAHMPCVLVEVSFIDNPAEGARLITPRYQHLAAQGIYQGVKAYFEQRGK
ncbi:MAG: N-acetylmuramoyl-L-alanine amidase [Bdellovibrionota bacterium]